MQQGQGHRRGPAVLARPQEQGQARQHPQGRRDEEALGGRVLHEERGQGEEGDPSGHSPSPQAHPREERPARERGQGAQDRVRNHHGHVVRSGHTEHEVIQGQGPRAVLGDALKPRGRVREVIPHVVHDREMGQEEPEGQAARDRDQRGPRREPRGVRRLSPEPDPQVRGQPARGPRQAEQEQHDQREPRPRARLIHQGDVGRDPALPEGRGLRGRNQEPPGVVPGDGRDHGVRQGSDCGRGPPPDCWTAIFNVE